MQTYLLAWNPSRTAWPDIDKDIQEIGKQGYLDRRWSTGNRKNIPVGSRFFLIRLGSADKGIIGSGVTTSETYYDTSWEQSKARSRSKALYVGLRFDFLSKVPLIKLQELQVHPLSSFYWSIRASGIYMPSEIALSLENIWLRKTKIQSNSTHKNSQCWLIKTTEGGPGYRDHWADFMSEKVVAVGWTAIKYDPSQFEHLEQYQKQIKAKYKWDTSYASSTIFKFSHQWQENDIAIICTGYAPNQTKDVYINGIARIGKYFYDKKSKWWRFKRQAVITPIDRYVPVKIFQKFLIKSSRQTIHGPFSQHKFQAFVNEIGFRLPVSDSRLPENTKHDLDSSQSTQRGGGFGSAKENKKVEEAAMRFVTRWYRKKGWSVSDVSAQCRGYDLHCVKGTTILHVEVKGSKGRDHQFIITPNEKQRWEVDPLFVLSLVTNIENTPTINQFKGASAMKSFCFNALSYMAVSIGS